MSDSLSQSNHPRTFGIRDLVSGSLLVHMDADRRKPLEQQACAEEGNQQRSLASIQHVVPMADGDPKPI